MVRRARLNQTTDSDELSGYSFYDGGLGPDLSGGGGGSGGGIALSGRTFGTYGRADLTFSRVGRGRRGRGGGSGGGGGAGGGSAESIVAARAAALIDDGFLENAVDMLTGALAAVGGVATALTLG